MVELDFIPAFNNMLAVYFHSSLDAVIEQANWDTSKVKDKLRREIDAHIASVQSAKISGLTKSYEVSYQD